MYFSLPKQLGSLYEFGPKHGIVPPNLNNN